MSASVFDLSQLCSSSHHKQSSAKDDLATNRFFKTIIMPKQPVQKFGAILGYAPGNVPAHSSDYESADDKEYPSRSSYMSMAAGHYCGFKFQCVEYARRWLILARGVTFPDVHMAYEIFDIPYFIAVNDKNKSKRTAQGRSDDYDDEEGTSKVAVKSIPNGGSELPTQGSLLIWYEGGFFRHTGHVAVVTEATENYVRVAEQNVTDASWNGRDYARELAVEVKTDKDGNKSYVLHEGLRARVMGWVVPEFTENHKPLLPESEIAVASLPGYGARR